MLSGGKDSFYAAMISRPIDLGLVLHYEFPRPSPHLANIGKTIETLLLAQIPILVYKLRKGREYIDTINILKKLNISEIVAGDVYIYDHLKYMESIAEEVGATLIEPLWGEDPVELLYKEFNLGIEALVIGTEDRASKWIGKELNRNNVEIFIKSCRELSLDPLGERGEYHTIVVSSPIHSSRLLYKIVGYRNLDGYLILILL